MFDVDEPSDAALAFHDPAKREQGVVDQRLESWFEPFHRSAESGYLGR
jgi:hypothetical protein